MYNFHTTVFNVWNYTETFMMQFCRNSTIFYCDLLNGWDLNGRTGRYFILSKLKWKLLTYWFKHPQFKHVNIMENASRISLIFSTIFINVCETIPWIHLTENYVCSPKLYWASTNKKETVRTAFEWDMSHIFSYLGL